MLKFRSLLTSMAMSCIWVSAIVLCKDAIKKVIEEAPCPVMTPQLRDAMGQSAVEVARAIDYVGAGTVEFLLDEKGAFLFS